MKKKILSAILTCLLVFSAATGCAQTISSEKESLTVTTEEIPETSRDDTSVKSENAEEPSEDTSAIILQIPVEDLTKEQQNMLAVMDALNMCMIENNCDYAPENPDFLWKALLYAIGNYPNLRDNQANGTLTIDNNTGTMIVYYQLVQEYATGITESYNDLPPLPEDAVVSRNVDTEYYDFPMGDRGLSYGKIASWTSNGDGTHTVEAQLIGADDESLIAAYEYVLVENPYAKDITDPMFTYTVRSVKKL
ncbi:MAG: hypothetical protein IJ409_08130 [Lachnospiraceae bacterium]|nr:hypothetical protein [Lachnospiraceae bacterium]